MEQICKDFTDYNLANITIQCSDAVVQEHWNVCHGKVNGI